MVHQPAHAFVGRRGFVDVVKRRNADVDVVQRDHVRTAVAIVAEVLQQNRYFAGGLIAEGAFVEFKGVVEGAHQLRREVGIVRIVEQQPQILGLDLAQLGRSWPGYGCNQQEGE